MEARAAAAGAVWPGLLGSLGALSLGCWSLWRSYRTTLQYYTGGFHTGERKHMPAAVPGLPARETNFLERQIRWVPDPATAVVLGGFRSLTRSPEGKMMLLTPLILMGLFGTMILAGRTGGIPELARPMLGLGVVSITMLCFVQLLCNSFGVDRDGFRAFVLSPCRRRDILLGKNLAVAPLAFGVCFLALVVLQVFQPVHSLHFLATLVQMLIGFVLCSLLGNAVSILAPSAISIGSLKPAKAKISTMLIHIVVAMLSPLVLLARLPRPGRRIASRCIGLDRLGRRSGDTAVPGDIGTRVRPGDLDLLALHGCPREMAATSRAGDSREGHATCGVDERVIRTIVTPRPSGPDSRRKCPAAPGNRNWRKPCADDPVW